MVKEQFVPSFGILQGKNVIEVWLNNNTRERMELSWFIMSTCAALLNLAKPTGFKNSGKQPKSMQ